MAAARPLGSAGRGPALLFATSSPAYLDKTNATAVHAALGLGADVFAADLIGTSRSTIAAIRGALAGAGLVVAADVRVGRPGSSDERAGGDGAAALLLAGGNRSPCSWRRRRAPRSSSTGGVIRRGRRPSNGRTLRLRAVRRPGAREGQPRARHRGPHRSRPCCHYQPQHRGHQGAGCPGERPPVHHRLTAGLCWRRRPAARGVRRARHRGPGGNDPRDLGVRRLRRLAPAHHPGSSRAPAGVPLAAQIAAGGTVPYPAYLAWRGLLEREPPRRPEPDRPAGPPSARSAQWKFAFTGSRCTQCGFVHFRRSGSAVTARRWTRWNLPQPAG